MATDKGLTGPERVRKLQTVLHAHPQWLNRAKEPLDEHTRYYCERDVDRHLQRWRKAADNKRVNQFLLRLENADRYLPTEFDRWRKRLQMAD